ncbi:MAG: hypothetical protein ACLU45_01055 [Dialister invisus]
MKEIGYALLAVLLMAGCGLDSGEKKNACCRRHSGGTGNKSP